MKLHDTIVVLIRDYPSLYQCKLDVTKHLFQCYGNGYEWIDGELVDEFHDRSIPLPDSEVFEDEEAEVKKFMEEHKDDWDNPNLKKYYAESIEGIRLKVRRNNMEAQHARVNCELMARTIHNYKTHESGFMDVIPFDLCQYSAICTVPEDVKEDWLKGITDEIYHVLHQKASSYSTNYFEGRHRQMVYYEEDKKKRDPSYVRERPMPTVEDLKAFTEKNNREWCIKAVQRINSMFPGTFKFNTLEEYDAMIKENQDRISKDIMSRLNDALKRD